MIRLGVFLTFLLYTTRIECARILGVYPTPSISHQVVFRAHTLEMVKRGHEVVVLTPDPVYRNKTPPSNLREIDLIKSYELMLTLLRTTDYTKNVERGAIMDLISMIKEDPAVMIRFELEIFSYPEVKSLIADKNQKFDLVIIEALSYTSLIFSKLYNAPTILFSSLYGIPNNYLTVGAVSRHPVFHPNLFRYKFRNLSILGWMQELKNEWDLYQYETKCEQIENAFLKSEFGPDAPTINDLQEYVELLFVNSHPIFDGNRPVSPGVVYLGALHLQAVQPLPQDLQTYMDQSTRGLIYVSLGTNVRPSMMDQDLLDAFFDAFEALPYDIMWKFDGDNLKRVPKNVRVQKWFPQRDLLGHPNLKLFITQGGLQSTDEAIDAEIPLVGIPFLGDQWYNVNKYVELGIGVEVDTRTLTADTIVNAALQVIGDESFRKNIAKLRAEMQDQPEKPIERAVWWTEYVLRHGRSKRLLGPTPSWSEYLMLDILIIVVVGITMMVAAATVALYYVVSLCLFKRKDKLKTS